MFGWPDSDELCEMMAERLDGKIILAFSRGKDSLGAWIQLNRYFDKVYPFHMDPFPGLRYIDESIKRLEDQMKTRIIRAPHPAVFQMMAQGLLMTPFNSFIVENYSNRTDTFAMYHYKVEHIVADLAADLGLPVTQFSATGVRAVDSPIRVMAVKKHGPVSENRRAFMPTYDWRAERLSTEISQSGIKLPVDYHMYGRTLDGLDFRFMAPLKKYFPDDFERIKVVFPLVEAVVLREESRRKHWRKKNEQGA